MVKDKQITDFIALQTGVLALYVAYPIAARPQIDARATTHQQVGEITHRLIKISDQPDVADQCARLAVKLGAFFPKTDTNLRLTGILKLHDKPYCVMQQGFQWLAEVDAENFNTDMRNLMSDMFMRATMNHTGALVKAYMTAIPRRLEHVPDL